MSSSLRVNTIVPSTGTNVAIGTANGTVTFTDSVNFVLGTGSSIFSPASNTLTFGTNDAERLRITSTGAVQITGADDQDNLLVKGGNTHFAVHQDDTDGEVSLRAQDGSGSNNSKYMTFFTNPSGSSAAERLRITSDGKMGVGTQSPDVLLHLKQDNADPYNTPLTVLKLHNGGGNQNSTTRLEFKTGAATCYIENKIGGANSGSGADLVFATPSSGTVGTERMRIHSDGVIQTFNHAECLAFQNAQSVTGGDASTHELGVSTFNFNRGGYTISSGNLIVPKTGMYRCFMRMESMISNSSYSIRAISIVPRVNGTASGVISSHWHSVAACPSSNTHYSFTDQYYLNLSANDAIDGRMTWYPYASRTQNFDLSISLFYIG